MSSFGAMLGQIGEDYRAHGRDWTKPGFRTLAIYRFGVWRMTIGPKILRAPLSLLYRTGFRFCRNIYGIELPYSAVVGRKVVLEHQGGIVVHGCTVIGDGCIIRQNCTFGIRSQDDLDAAPTLGAGVDVGAGAVILGRIHLGDHSVVGANAVVLSDVPAGALAVGVPARIIKR
jgi:serine O-acetyltransferase